MRYYKIINNGYLVAIGNGSGGEQITEAEYNNLLEVIHTKPIAESGYDYRLREDLEWELYELPIVEEEQASYTAEQLEAMTSTELREICSEMGISGTMTKANMISLIMGKQSNSL